MGYGYVGTHVPIWKMYSHIDEENTYTLTDPMCYDMYVYAHMHTNAHDQNTCTRLPSIYASSSTDIPMIKYAYASWEAGAPAKSH